MWQYREGTIDLGQVANWQNIYGGTPAQPAYAPSNTPGNFLPALFKATVALYDWQAGDIVAHTNDGANGNPALGQANYLFTAPTAGTASISGDVWNARDIGRAQAYSLLVDGVQQASGLLPGDGTVTRSNPLTFSLSNVALAAGDTVDLVLSRGGNPTFGDFLGSALTINLSPNVVPGVPEPGSLVLLTSGLAALGVAWARRRTKSRA